MENGVAMFIRTGSVVIITPISYKFGEIGNIGKATFFIYTNNHEIGLSIMYPIEGEGFIPSSLDTFFTNLRNKIIDCTVNRNDAVILESEIYYKINTDNLLHSVEITVNSLQSSIHPSLPVLNGLG